MKHKTLLLLLLIFLLTVLIPTFSITSFAKNAEITTYSPYCLLIEASTGKIIYQKNAYEVVPPASTTKIMTAILALEHCNLTDTTTVSYNAIHSVPYSYSHANLVEGEILTIEQLLHVLLIPSANDAANVLAEHIAGSIESFASMMNTKAIELGCQNTHFVNANGIHSEDHYSTAYDLALMGRYAMQNETFRNIVATTQYTLPSTNKYPEANRIFNTTNELLKVDHRARADNYYYSTSTGIKTGYTNPAKDCIVASAKQDNMEYIVVILGADRTENGLSGRYLDCKTLFNYAFEHYTLHTIAEKNSLLKQIQVSNATSKTRNLDVLVQDEITLLLKKNTDISSIMPSIDIPSDLTAPISKNSVIGSITYIIDGNTYSSALLAGSDVTQADYKTTILTIASIVLVLLFLNKLLNSNHKKKKKNLYSKKKKKNSTGKHHERDNYLYW